MNTATSAPQKKCCGQHPERLRFVPIDPEHQHQVKRDGNSGGDESDQQSDGPSFNPDQQENNETEQ